MQFFQKPDFFLRFPSQGKQISRTKIIFGTNRLPKQVFLKCPMTNMSFVNISTKSLQITQGGCTQEMLVRAQLSATQKNRMTLNSNQKKGMTQNSTQKKQNNSRCKLKKSKKWVLRIDFSVTISFLYHNILSLTSVQQTVSVSAISSLDLIYSLSFGLIIRGFWRLLHS